VQVFVAFGVRVLHRDSRAKLDMGADCLAERLVVGHADLIKRRQVELDEPLALWLGDLEMPVYRDQRSEAPQLTRKAVRTPERFGRERRQVIDVVGLTLTEQRLEQGSAKTLL
jgi:hypothetical protein